MTLEQAWMVWFNRARLADGPPAIHSFFLIISLKYMNMRFSTSLFQLNTPGSLLIPQIYFWNNINFAKIFVFHRKLASCPSWPEWGGAWGPSSWRAAFALPTSGWSWWRCSPELATGPSAAQLLNSQGGVPQQVPSNFPEGGAYDFRFLLQFLFSAAW